MNICKQGKTRAYNHCEELYRYYKSLECQLVNINNIDYIIVRLYVGTSQDKSDRSTNTACTLPGNRHNADAIECMDWIAIISIHKS